jgi:hypothetical protein
LITLISLGYFWFFFKIFHYDQEMNYLVESPIADCNAIINMSTPEYSQNSISLAALDLKQLEQNYSEGVNSFWMPNMESRIQKQGYLSCFCKQQAENDDFDPEQIYATEKSTG